MSGETNRLIDLARQISTQPDPREYDQMVSDRSAGFYHARHGY